MRWIYRLQQRLAFTRSEAAAALLLTGLLFLGLAARHLQHRAALPEADAGVLLEDAFAEAAAALYDTLAVDSLERASQAADTLRAADALPGGGPAPRPGEEGSDRQPGAGGRLDLNAATAAELEGLPRIGPALARRIVAYRAAYGPFRRVEDLTRVRGIGKKTLAQLTPYLRVQ